MVTKAGKRAIPVGDTEDTPPPPQRVALLDLPAEILANIAVHLDKPELKAFARLCKYARRVASRYLFATVSLRDLDTERMHDCFAALSSDQLKLVKQLSMQFYLPHYEPRGRQEEVLAVKWLGVLLHLMGPQAQDLDVKVWLDIGSEVAGGPLDGVIDVMALLAEKMKRYKLTVECDGQEAYGSDIIFRPIFTNRIISSIPLKQITAFKLLGFDSHFGKEPVGEPMDYYDDDDEFLDFKLPSRYEKDLISALDGMANLTDLHLVRCFFSPHFARAYPFKLLELKLELGSMQLCSHDVTASFAISLVRANRATLRELLLKGTAINLSKFEPIELPHLTKLSLDTIGAPDKSLRVFVAPRLAALFVTHTRFQPYYLNRLLEKANRLSALVHIRIERSIDFAKLREHECANFLSKCAELGVRVELHDPGITGYKFRVWDKEGYLSIMADYIRALDVEISAPPDNWATISKCITPHLLTLRLSLPTTALTTATATGTQYALASEYLLPFVESLEAPLLEVLSINFQTPFIDYLAGFSRFIASKAFSAKFLRCKQISGTITADTGSLWTLPKVPAPDAAKEQNAVQKTVTVQKPLSVWLKEQFMAACKANDIQTYSLYWRNASLVV